MASKAVKKAKIRMEFQNATETTCNKLEKEMAFNKY